MGKTYDELLLNSKNKPVFLSDTARIKPTRQAVAGVQHALHAPTSSHAASPGAQASSSHQALTEKHIVVISLGAEEDIGSLIQGMADFAPPGSKVTIVSPGTPEQLPGSSGSCQLEHLQGSIASQETLLKVVASLIQLLDVATATGRTAPLHTLVTVRHPRTIEVINYINSRAHPNSNSSPSYSMHSSRGTH